MAKTYRWTQADYTPEIDAIAQAYGENLADKEHLISEKNSIEAALFRGRMNEEDTRDACIRLDEIDKAINEINAELGLPVWSSEEN